MGNIFAGSEIIELGIQIEKNGGDFYNTLAGRTKNENAKEVFVFLAREEQKHIAIFKKMLKSARRYEPPEASYDEYFAYMKVLADGYVFTKKDKGKDAADSAGTDKESIEIGIGFEKESILFYEGMKKTVPEYDLNILEELIGQEQGHLRRLVALRGNV